MSHALLAIQNILQNSNIFIGSRETVLFTPFGGKKVTQFSGLPPTSVSYLKMHRYCNSRRKSCCLSHVLKPLQCHGLYSNTTRPSPSLFNCGTMLYPKPNYCMIGKNMVKDQRISSSGYLAVYHYLQIHHCYLQNRLVIKFAHRKRSGHSVPCFSRP